MFNVFAVPSSDQSVFYLGQIFGNIGIALVGTGPTLLPTMFKVFNSALLVLGTFLVAYVTVAGVLKTAQEGEFMGKHWNSLWMPLRMLMGIAGLVPTSSGYCAIQIIMMWIIMQGIGAADSVWIGAVGYFKAGGTLYPASPAASSYVDAAGTFPSTLSSLFQNLVCQAAITKQATNNANAVATTPPPTVNASQVVYTFGRVDPNLPLAANECGTLTLSGAIDPATGAADPTAVSSQQQAIQTLLPVMEAMANYYVNQVVATTGCWTACTTKPATSCPFFDKYSGFSDTSCSLTGTTGPDATAGANLILSQAGSNFMADAVTLFYGYGANYTTQYNLAHNQTSSSVSQKPYDQAISTGWIFAGAYYYYIAAATNAMSNVYNNFVNGVSVSPVAWPTSYGPSATPANPNNDFSSAAIANMPQNAYTASGAIAGQLAAAASSAITGNSVVVGSSGTPTIPSVASGLLSSITNAAYSVSNEFIALLTPGGGDPLVKIHALGHNMLYVADQVFIDFLIAAALFGVYSTVVVVMGITVNPLQGVSTIIFSYILPVVFFLLGYLIAIGGLLGIYLPLLPFIIFSFGAMGWFMGVIEAITAAPIIAIGILMPGGQHEIMGRAEASIMMTLNIFLAPTLMIFGLVSAMLLAFVLVEFINGGFNLVLVNMAASPSGAGVGPTIGVIEAFLYLMAYSYLVITVLNKCYSLIFFLRDRVITWVGGHATGFGEEQMAGEVKQGISAGGGAATKVAAGAVKGTAKVGFAIRGKGTGAAPTPGIGAPKKM